MRYTDFLGNKEDFVERVKDTLNRVAYGKVDEIKRDVANDFLSNNGDDHGSERVEEEN